MSCPATTISATNASSSYENNVLRLNAEIDTFPPDDVLSRGRSIGEAENDSMGTARIGGAKGFAPPRSTALRV